MGSPSRRYIVKAHGGGVHTRHTTLTGALKEKARLEAQLGAQGVEIEQVTITRPVNVR